MYLFEGKIFNVLHRHQLCRALCIKYSGENVLTDRVRNTILAKTKNGSPKTRISTQFVPTNFLNMVLDVLIHTKNTKGPRSEYTTIQHCVNHDKVHLLLHVSINQQIVTQRYCSSMIVSPPTMLHNMESTHVVPLMCQKQLCLSQNVHFCSIRRVIF